MFNNFEENSMQFNGYEVTGQGNAKVYINNSGQLVVENIGSYGTDGLLIKTSGKEITHIYFAESPEVKNGDLKITSNAKLDGKTSVTTGETYYSYDGKKR